MIVLTGSRACIASWWTVRIRHARLNTADCSAGTLDVKLECGRCEISREHTEILEEPAADISLVTILSYGIDNIAIILWNGGKEYKVRSFNCATNGENTENNGLRERCTRNTVMQMYIKHYLNAVSSSINCDRLDCICQKFHQRDPKVEIFLLLPRLGRCTWWQLFQCRRQ